MHEQTTQYDPYKAELEFRFGRIRNDLAGRRARRIFARRGTEAGRSDIGDTTFTTAL